MSQSLLPIAKTRIQPDDAEIDGVKRPVSWRVVDYPSNLEIAPHCHERAQLIYAVAGIMSVETKQGIWMVPPQRAVWVPGGIEHCVRSKDGVSMRSLYFKPFLVAHLPQVCRVISVSPLFRELAKTVVSLPSLYQETPENQRLIGVLIDQLQSMTQTSLYLPGAEDSRLQKVLAAIAHNPAANNTINDYAKLVGVSERTLSRLFISQTNLSFRDWRQQARLLEALARLAAGQTVSTVALDLGYESQSAFGAMFKRVLGVTPKQYFQTGSS